MSAESPMRPILNELARGTAKEQAKALGELRILAQTAEVRSEFIVMGHAPKIVAYLSRGDADCRVGAAGVIANIAATDACRATIIAAGALQPLVGMISSNYKDFQEEAAGALRTLTASEKGQHAVLAAGALRPLVENLSSGSAKGKVAAAGTLGFLACHLPKAEVKGFLPGLVAMLSSDIEEFSFEAAGAICNVAITCPNREAVMEAGALTPLLHLLSSSSLRGRAQAAEALACLATEGYDFEATGSPPPRFAGAIADAGAVPGLVALLAGGVGECSTGQGLDPTISNHASTQAARTLSLLAIEGRTHPVLIADGAIPALIMLLQEGKGCPMAKGWSASVLEQLARDGEVKKEIYASVPLVAKTVGGQKHLLAQLTVYV